MLMYRSGACIPSWYMLVGVFMGTIKLRYDEAFHSGSSSRPSCTFITSQIVYKIYMTNNWRVLFAKKNNSTPPYDLEQIRESVFKIVWWSRVNLL